MKRAEADAIEATLMDMIAKRRNLGGYSPDAPDLLFLATALYELVRHTREQMPAPVKKRK